MSIMLSVTCKPFMLSVIFSPEITGTVSPPISFEDWVGCQRIRAKKVGNLRLNQLGAILAISCSDLDQLHALALTNHSLL